MNAEPSELLFAARFALARVRRIGNLGIPLLRRPRPIDEKPPRWITDRAVGQKADGIRLPRPLRERVQVVVVDGQTEVMLHAMDVAHEVILDLRHLLLAAADDIADEAVEML